MTTVEAVLFDSLDAPGRALLDRYTGARRFEAGERILLEGEHDRALYFVRSGVLEVDQHGFEPVAVEAPAVIGEMAFLDGSPRSATVVARTDGELLRLSWESFERIQAEDPTVAMSLALGVGRALAARLRVANDRRR